MKYSMEFQMGVAQHYKAENTVNPTQALKEENERHAYYRDCFVKMHDLLRENRA